MANGRLDALLAKARALYIINAAGLLEHHEAFIETDDDEDLHSALFATVNMFANQIGAGGLELIALENHKFAFANYEGSLIVLDVQVDLSQEDSIWLIQQIMDRFDQMKNLLEMDTGGNLVLRTLFGERGKAITWDTIRAINEEMLIERSKQGGYVETSNKTNINIRSKSWIKIRQIATSIVTNQTDIIGLYLIVKNKGVNNILYSGRQNTIEINEVMNRGIIWIEDPMGGSTIEPEIHEIEGHKVLYLPILSTEGALMQVVSDDEEFLNQYLPHLERIIAAVEKILNR